MREKGKTYWINKFNEKWNNFYDYSKLSEDICWNKKEIIICPIHGEFLQTPNSHLTSGCPKCGRIRSDQAKREKGKRNFEEYCKNQPYDYSKVEYVNSKTKVCIICPIHGEFETTPHVHIKDKCKCPKCSANKRELDLYNSLRKFFNNEQILFQYSPEWLKPQRFDIYIPKYNIAIEYDGIQHFKAQKLFGGENKLEYQKELDNKKSNKCIENNCTLYRIPYNHSTEDIIDLILNINNFIINARL